MSPRALFLSLTFIVWARVCNLFTLSPFAVVAISSPRAFFTGCALAQSRRPFLLLTKIKFMQFGIKIKLAIFLLAVFVLPNNVFAGSSVYTGFEDYNLGELSNHENWTATYSYSVNVVDTFSKSGDKSIYFGDPGAYVSGADLDLTTSSPESDQVNVVFDYYPEQIDLYDTYSHFSLAVGMGSTATEKETSTSLCVLDTADGEGTVHLASNGNGWQDSYCTGPIVGYVTQGNWYKMELQADWTNNTLKARINGGAWCDSISISADYQYITQLRFWRGNFNNKDQLFYIDNLYVGSVEGGLYPYNYVGWGSDQFDIHYFSPIYPVNYEKYGCVSGQCEGWNYVFDVEVGNGIAGTWNLVHSFEDTENFFDDKITLEELDAARGSVTYTFIKGTDIDFYSDDNYNEWIYVTYPSFTDTQQKFYHLRYHNSADTTQYAGVYFSLRGDANFWEFDGVSTYDTCEKFDSAWTKAICHMVVVPSGYFPGKISQLKNDFKNAFPFLVSIQEAFLHTANTVYAIDHITTPTKPVSAAWNGMSIQLWDMSVIVPYVETFRGYASLVLWLMFIFWIFKQVEYMWQDSPPPMSPHDYISY